MESDTDTESRDVPLYEEPRKQASGEKKDGRPQVNGHTKTKHQIKTRHIVRAEAAVPQSFLNIDRVGMNLQEGSKAQESRAIQSGQCQEGSHVVGRNGKGHRSVAEETKCGATKPSSRKRKRDGV